MIDIKLLFKNMHEQNTTEFYLPLFAQKNTVVSKSVESKFCKNKHKPLGLLMAILMMNLLVYINT